MLKASVIAGVMSVVFGHQRLSMPEPRSTANGITTGPCGPETGDWSGPVTDIEPGLYNIEMTDVAAHGQHSWRVSLSRENADTNADFDCTLISHVPQYTQQNVNTARITLEIPDVECDLCALRVEMIQPSGDCCNKANGECGTTYYSCANVRISGKKDRDELECKEPCMWPFRDWEAGVFSSQQDDDTMYWKTESPDTISLRYSHDQEDEDEDNDNNDDDDDETSIEDRWVQPLCNDLTEPTECKIKGDGDGNSDGDVGEKNGAYGYSTFSNGGKMEAGGAIAIVLLIILVIAVGATWYMKKRGVEDGDATAYQMHSIQSQSDVRV